MSVSSDFSCNWRWLHFWHGLVAAHRSCKKSAAILVIGILASATIAQDYEEAWIASYVVVKMDGTADVGWNMKSTGGGGGSGGAVPIMVPLHTDLTTKPCPIGSVNYQSQVGDVVGQFNGGEWHDLFVSITIWKSNIDGVNKYQYRISVAGNMFTVPYTQERFWTGVFPGSEDRGTWQIVSWSGLEDDPCQAGDPDPGDDPTPPGGGGDGGDDPPDDPPSPPSPPDDPPGESSPLTGIDCIDNFLAQLWASPIFDVLNDFRVSEEANFVLDFDVPMPLGIEPYYFRIDTKPDPSTTLGAAVDDFRLVFRFIFTVLIWVFFLLRCNTVLRQY